MTEMTEAQRSQFEKWWNPKTKEGGEFYGCSENWGAWKAWQAAYACGAADASERLKLAEQKLLEHDIVWDGRQYSFEPRSE